MKENLSKISIEKLCEVVGVPCTVPSTSFCCNRRAATFSSIDHKGCRSHLDSSVRSWELFVSAPELYLCCKQILTKELEAVGLRLNKRPPQAILQTHSSLKCSDEENALLDTYASIKSNLGDLQTVSWFQFVPFESDANALSEKRVKDFSVLGPTPLLVHRIHLKARTTPVRKSNSGCFFRVVTLQ
uniref:Uncharacterized protein n=1 Tax=Ananas comosus var. bracteatus TaxID=296719 RepID=A0A6V7NJX4_ANACO|nr:unnamed protein product [Ananas comosus var. bracteatus]